MRTQHLFKRLSNLALLAAIFSIIRLKNLTTSHEKDTQRNFLDIDDVLIEPNDVVPPDKHDLVVVVNDAVPPQKKRAIFLPLALQPVTYLECCKFMLNRDTRPTTQCRGVCFSKEICEDELYPYSSKEEKEFFYHSPSHSDGLKQQTVETVEYRRTKRRECEKAAPVTPPQPAKWCQQPQQHTKPRQHIMNLTSISMGCSAVMGMAGKSGPFDRMILFPAGKLAFCGIPKVGISAWIQFLRFTVGAKDYQSFPHNKADINYFWFDRTPPTSQTHILQSDEWTKAVFLRDPAERFLSAYLDKIEGRGYKDRKTKKKKLINMTFAEFIDLVGKRNIQCGKEQKVSWKKTNMGMSWCTDPHWRPQSWSCGLWELLPHFDVVGNINNADIATKSLLEKVDMWDSYGKHYRTSKRDEDKRPESKCRTLPTQQLGSKDEFAGFQQISNVTESSTTSSFVKKGTYAHSHQKNSGDKMKKYYTKELLEKVKRIYADDYRLWNALSMSNAGWLSGKEMAVMLNPTCAVD